MKTVAVKSVALLLLLPLLVILTVAVAGCQKDPEPTPTPTPSPFSERFDLTATLVPDTDFDIYVFARQVEPTLVPGYIVNISRDFAVDSLALWGINAEGSYVISGGLTITGSNEAAGLFNQVPEDSDFWAGISGETVHFVYGYETAGRELRVAIQDGKFKNYDNEIALAEIGLFPDEGSTTLGAVAVATPDEALANLVAEYTDPEIAGLIDIIMKTANIEVITAGFYSPGPIDVADMAREIEATGWFRGEIGVLASIKSAWSELIFEPIARAALEAAGFSQVEIHGITGYRGEIEITGGKKIPIIFATADNRLYVAISGEGAYAELLLAGLALGE